VFASMPLFCRPAGKVRFETFVLTTLGDQYGCEIAFAQPAMWPYSETLSPNVGEPPASEVRGTTLPKPFGKVRDE
jgi:hypothetical protein